MDLAAEWGELLRAEAAGYAGVAIANLKREFPSDVRHTMTGPGDLPVRAPGPHAGLLRQPRLAFGRGDALAADAPAAHRGR